MLDKNLLAQNNLFCYQLIESVWQIFWSGNFLAKADIKIIGVKKKHNSPEKKNKNSTRWIFDSARLMLNARFPIYEC
jgi:hypothetical protein